MTCYTYSLLVNCKGECLVTPLKQKKMESNHHSSINKIAINVKTLKKLNIELKNKSMEKIDDIY